jgi:uncharacterized coiled-coil protein SlyX
MQVQSIYFKFRDRFNFSPHRFEVGNPIIQNRQLEDNFFLLKIYELSQDDFQDYYYFHLNHFLEKHPSQEVVFFDHVLDIVKVRIDYFKRQDPITSKYTRHTSNARKLEAFLAFLRTIDRWHKTETLESVIAEKNRMISQLQEKIALLEAKLHEAKEYEASEKVVITNGYFATFMDIVNQIQDLTVSDTTKFVRSQGQSPWYKMIAKYFQHGDKPIPIETAHNYLPPRNKPKPSKYTDIDEKDKLFKIVRRDQK